MIRLTRHPLADSVKARLTDLASRLAHCISQGEEPPPVVLDGYRETALKSHLILEAHGKCMYCESRISHVYFGDVEHIRPKSLFQAFRLAHDNLGLVCAICNNAKGEFWDDLFPLLNPYEDDPEQELLPLGFMIARRPSHERARLTIEKVQLNRPALMERRKERIDLLQSLADQYVLAPEGQLKEVLRAELCRQASDDSEYAFVVRAYLQASCGLDCSAAA